MKKVAICCILLLAAILFTLCACDLGQKTGSNTSTGGGSTTNDETATDAETKEEYLSADAARSLLLDKIGQLEERTANIGVTLVHKNNDEDYTYVYEIVGERDDRVAHMKVNGIEYDAAGYDGVMELVSESYYGKVGNEYVCRYHYLENESTVEKGYWVMSKDEFEEVMEGRLRTIIGMCLGDEIQSLLQKNDTLVSGKKITKGTTEWYEVRLTTEKKKVVVNIKGGRIDTVKWEEAYDNGEKDIEEATYTYDTLNLTMPSLSGYPKDSD